MSRSPLQHGGWPFLRLSSASASLAIESSGSFAVSTIIALLLAIQSIPNTTLATCHQTFSR